MPKRKPKRRENNLPENIHPNAIHRLRWKVERSRRPTKRRGVSVVATTHAGAEEKPSNARRAELAMDSNGNVYFLRDKKRGGKFELLFGSKDADWMTRHVPEPGGYER